MRVYVCVYIYMQIMIDAGWPARFWASTLCFIIVPTGVMGLLLLVRNCWLAVCLRYFVVLLSNEARAIMLPVRGSVQISCRHLFPMAL